MACPFAALAALTALAALLLAEGCASQPAFRAELPDTLNTGGKAIAIVGDLQQTSGLVRLVRRRENNAVPQQRLIADLRQQIDALGALVIVGDLVYSARSRRQWDHFDSLIAPFAARMPVLPAIGNHDYPCYFIELCRTGVIADGMGDRFPWVVPGQPYRVSSGDLLLLFLDTESAIEAQAGWLAEQLAEAADAYSAAVVFFHRAAYTNSIDRGAAGNAAVQQFVVPALRDANVPVIVFSGHIHGLEYIVRDGVHYFTAAGGGGPRGPMADERPFDVYRGPDCPRPRDGALLRPFNYMLLQPTQDALAIEMRGFCRADAEVRVLDRVEVPLR